MADTKDSLEARRRLRQRLGELGTQYPDLKEPESQQRLTEALAQKESTPCHASPQDSQEADPQEADT